MPRLPTAAGFEALNIRGAFNSMIQLFHVSKTFGSTVALEDLTFRIREGEFVFVTGPSGAGKTTLLRLVFGAESPSSGYLLVNGVNLNRVTGTRLSLLRRKIGFVFQDFKLLSNKSVVDNVALALEVAGERSSLIRKKSRQALKLVGLIDKEKAYPLQLSGGEQQRVAIARAIVKEPIVLLADEPTGNLDPDITQEIMVLFRSIHMEGTTVVIATHNRELLRNTAQRTIVLNRGRMIEEK
jgi:cell division transport system ATP-binding protein